MTLALSVTCDDEDDISFGVTNALAISNPATECRKKAAAAAAAQYADDEDLILHAN